MVTKRNVPPAAIEPRTWTSEDEIDVAIKKLNRRVNELESLASSGFGYNDPEVNTATSNFRTTILEVFGANSPEYREHQYHRLWLGVESSDMSVNELNDGVRKGIANTVGLVRGLIDRLQEHKEDLQLPTGKPKIKTNTTSGADGPIFVGHGGSHMWLVLKDFLENRLHHTCLEFNSEPVAGISTLARLEEMLEKASFAFLLMTAEDELSDGTRRARENVVHEVGLFQGKLGFKRAIVLLEEGCTEFSNIEGLSQIRFRQGNISDKFEDIRRVLEREGIQPNP